MSGEKMDMKKKTNTKECTCNSTIFHNFEKYSQALNCVVEYVQCESCGLITAPESKNYNLSRIYNAEYFNNVDYGWKGRAKILLIYIKYINILVPLFSLQT